VFSVSQGSMRLGEMENVALLLFTFLVIFLLNIIKIRQCFREL